MPGATKTLRAGVGAAGAVWILKPYGNEAAFVNECTGCHQPMRGADYVYTLPITNAKIAREEVVNNKASALPISLPYQPLGWGAITMHVDPRTHTTATLFGDDAAIRAVGTAPRGEGKAPAYPRGAVVALVTWTQRDDPHWFGGRIPDAPESVEFVRIAAGGQKNEYRRFAARAPVKNARRLVRPGCVCLFCSVSVLHGFRNDFRAPYEFVNSTWAC